MKLVTIVLTVDSDDDGKAERCVHSALSNLIDAGDITDFSIEKTENPE